LNKKSTTITILIFGGILALLIFIMKFFQYRYFIGNLDTDVYTSVVATMFTIIGIWLGYHFLKPEKEIKIIREPVKNGIDHSKLKEIGLNDREYEILKLISEGHSNKIISANHDRKHYLCDCLDGNFSLCW